MNRGMNALKHGGSLGGKRSPEYNAWLHMRERCLDPKNPRYRDYGGRGIQVCNRWLSSFENFLKDMGDRPSPQHSLDRTDNGKNYELSNCQWATRLQQQNNTRWNTRVTVNGESRTLAEWARVSGLDYKLIFLRLQRGWTIEQAVTLKPCGGRRVRPRSTE